MKTNLQNNFQKLIGYKTGRFIPSTYKFKVNKNNKQIINNSCNLTCETNFNKNKKQTLQII